MTKKFILENIKTLFYALIIAILIRSILIQPFYIPSSSMEPNLLVGDRLFVTKFSYGYSKHSFPFSPPIFKDRLLSRNPQRGDVIVFKTPADNRTDYIKRLIGKSGDKIQFISGDLYINNNKIVKTFIENSKIYCGNEEVNVKIYKEKISTKNNYKIAYFSTGSFTDSDVYVVPKNHYFFLGDNRDCSSDSRYLTRVGYVKKENLVGKARFLFFSNDKTKGSFFTFWKWHHSIRFERILKKIN